MTRATGAGSAARRRLVLLSGPVAAGKTTVAERLATLAREQGRTAAAVDMDEIVAVVAGRDWTSVRSADRIAACRLASAIVTELLDLGTEVVTVAGTTLSPFEWDEVIAHLHPAPPILHVLLRVSVAEAQRRASRDPRRGSTRDPGFVASLAGAVAWEAVRHHDVELDTDVLGVNEVVAAIATRVFAHGGPDAGGRPQ